MRVSELSRRSGVPVSSIKFYIREGLLPPGERTGPNQARYGDAHLARLELIRTLRERCELAVETVRRVVATVDEPNPDADPIRVALHGMKSPAPERRGASAKLFAEAQEEVTRFLDALPWTLKGEHHDHVDALADVLVDLRQLVDHETLVELLAPYARAAWMLSEIEMGTAVRGERIKPRPGDALDHPVTLAILGTLLIEPMILTLRRCALWARGTRLWRGMEIPVAEPIEDSR